MERPVDFTGRRIVVTGASRGIGRATASYLAAAGATIVGVSRDADAIGRSVAELPGDEHAALAFDVGDESAWEDSLTRRALSGVDGIVTAAAVLAPIGPLRTLDAAEFWQAMKVNVLGTLLPVKACLASLERLGGAVVTFAGGGATSPLPRYDAYASSKAAVVRLTENLGVELSQCGVRLNSVSPGFVATEIHQATILAGAENAGEDYLAKTQTLLRAGSTAPSEAAELAAFLLHEASAGITGRVLSAKWDPWREESFHRALRSDPELATLRRVDGTMFAAVSR